MVGIHDKIRDRLARGANIIRPHESLRKPARIAKCENRRLDERSRLRETRLRDLASAAGSIAPAC